MEALGTESRRTKYEGIFSDDLEQWNLEIKNSTHDVVNKEKCAI